MPLDAATALAMARRFSPSGSGTNTILSRRPGRRSAGSIMSGRFVAATRYTPSRPSTPSISASIWFTTLSAARLEPPPSPRFGARASSSSKKRMHGAAARARAKSDRTARSDSPTHLLRSSGPLMEMKFARDSFAQAFATSVLPQPGGPCSRTPAPGGIPTLRNRSGQRMGSATAKRSSSLTVAMPPTSLQVTPGTVAKPSRRSEGCTFFIARSKSAGSIQINSSSAGCKAWRRPPRSPMGTSRSSPVASVCIASTRSAAPWSGTWAGAGAGAGPAEALAGSISCSTAERWPSVEKTRVAAPAAASWARASRSAPT